MTILCQYNSEVPWIGRLRATSIWCSTMARCFRSPASSIWPINSKKSFLLSKVSSEVGHHIRCCPLSKKNPPHRDGFAVIKFCSYKFGSPRRFLFQTDCGSPRSGGDYEKVPSIVGGAVGRNNSGRAKSTYHSLHICRKPAIRKLVSYRSWIFRISFLLL